MNAAAMEGIEDTSTMNANVTLNSAVSQLSVPERIERMKRIEAEKADILATLQGQDLETSMQEMMGSMPQEKRRVLREVEEVQRQLQQQQQQPQSPERQADAPPHQSTPLLKRSDSVVTVGSMSAGLNKIQLAAEIAESSQALMEDINADAAAVAAAEAEEKELLASDNDEKMQ